jgi:hypothetical protein
MRTTHAATARLTLHIDLGENDDAGFAQQVDKFDTFLCSP